MTNLILRRDNFKNRVDYPIDYLEVGQEEAYDPRTHEVVRLFEWILVAFSLNLLQKALHRLDASSNRMCLESCIRKLLVDRIENLRLQSLIDRHVACELLPDTLLYGF